MSAASSPPPPPSDGLGKSPAPKHGTPPTGPALQKIRDKMDGTTAKTAHWTNALILKPHQAQFLVHRRTEQPPAKWQRCTEGEARYESEAGYPVWQLTSSQARRMDPLGPFSNNWDSAVERQIRTIEEAEVALVDRRQHLPTEDIMEGAEESDDVFDSPSPPSRSSTRTGSGSIFARFLGPQGS